MLDELKGLRNGVRHSLVMGTTIKSDRRRKVPRPLEIGIVMPLVGAFEEQDVGVVRVLDNGWESRGQVELSKRYWTKSENRCAAIADQTFAAFKQLHGVSDQCYRHMCEGVRTVNR